MKKLFALSFMFSVLVAGFISCTKSNSSPATPHTALLSLSANATVGGNILVDSSGRAVYNFVFDDQGKATCLGGCAIVWPHEYFAGLTQSNLGTGLNIADFGVVTNSDGGMQTTFKGHPLYIYTGDAKTSGVWSVTGNNIEGGVWFAGQATFTVFISNNKLTEGADSAYLTTPDGFALYTTTAATADASLTPYKPTSATINVPARLSSADFAINTSGQLTYKNVILYTSSSDHNRGDITGASITNTSLEILQ
jgi:predicted lipoprotein with Yx(FWY)xxD motif